MSVYLEMSVQHAHTHAIFWCPAFKWSCILTDFEQHGRSASFEAQKFSIVYSRMKSDFQQSQRLDKLIRDHNNRSFHGWHCVCLRIRSVFYIIKSGDILVLLMRKWALVGWQIIPELYLYSTIWFLEGVHILLFVSFVRIHFHHFIPSFGNGTMP